MSESRSRSRSATARGRVAFLWVALLGVLIVSVSGPTIADQSSAIEVPEVLIFRNVLDFHSSPDCSARPTDRLSTSIALKDALERGLKACPICHPEKSDPITKFFASDSIDPSLLIEGGDRAREAVARVLKMARYDWNVPFVRPTEAQLRAFASQAAAIAKDDADIFDKEFTRRVQAINPDHKGPGDLPVDASGKTYISLYSPVRLFQQRASERVRKMESLTGIPFTTTIEIAVDPTLIDSPDIERVVVRRNGAVVPPLRSTLALKIFTTQLGAKTALHAGSVFYPLSAFAPGRTVTVSIIGIARFGRNLRRDFDGADLRLIY